MAKKTVAATEQLRAHLKTGKLVASEVRALLGAGADPNVIIARGRSALCVALELGYEQEKRARASAVARELLAAGADVSHGAKVSSTPLFQACDALAVDLVDLLLENGAQCQPGHLMGVFEQFASEDSTRQLTIMRRLIAAGCPIEGLSQDGVHSPLIRASDSGMDEPVRYLLDQGANVDGANVRGETPLMYAAGNLSTQHLWRSFEHPARVRVVRLLLERGADPNARSTRGATPLDCATNSGNGEIVSVLKAAGAVAPPRRGKRPVDSGDSRSATWEQVDTVLRACGLYKKNIDVLKRFYFDGKSPKEHRFAMDGGMHDHYAKGVVPLIFRLWFNPDRDDAAWRAELRATDRFDLRYSCNLYSLSWSKDLPGPYGFMGGLERRVFELLRAAPTDESRWLNPTLEGWTWRLRDWLTDARFNPHDVCQHYAGEWLARAQTGELEQLEHAIQVERCLDLLHVVASYSVKGAPDVRVRVVSELRAGMAAASGTPLLLALWKRAQEEVISAPAVSRERFVEELVGATRRGR